MNILISGASGYLGSNILEYLSKKGNNISIIERDYQIKNKQNSYDVFLYLSNPNEIDFNQDAKQATLDMLTHFYAIEQLLNKITVISILYASTVRIYDYNKNVYACTHLFVESLLENYTREHNITLSKLRFGNIFGGSISSMKKRDTLVPHVFIKSALAKKKITLLTDGVQYRDFTPISCVNKYIDYIMKNKPKKIDISTGVNFKIIEVVEIIVDEIPNILIEVSTKHLNETIQEYPSVLHFTKHQIEKEIRKIIHQWSINSDSDFN